MEIINRSPQTTDSYILKPHPLSGTRQRAIDLVAELPDDFSGMTVTVDASEMKAYAQCFVDELCKQILQVHHAESLKIITENEPLKSRVEFSAQLRNFTDRISFV
jgi:hypothetical protein